LKTAKPDKPGLAVFSFTFFGGQHTHTPVYRPFVQDYPGEKGKTNLDSTKARDSEWQWHQLGHMQVCTSNTSAPHYSSFFTGWMPFLPPDQQHQSTEGKRKRRETFVDK